MAILQRIFLLGAISVYSLPALAQGDPDRGESLYRVCAACHGDRAQGSADTRAPRLAGQFEWYLVQQLKNFRAGLRGVNPADQNGVVMKPMADMLPDEQAIEDVVAYIMTQRPPRYRYRP